ncbi:hypothetical protein PVAG01_02563 [Phlyctema vagabunda]|uniref:Uncharacterized protein n=1 Tax=Phlyctema vagabunda TaxID=108571 RepID=A0ABR4PQY2_9HELO
MHCTARSKPWVLVYLPHGVRCSVSLEALLRSADLSPNLRRDLGRLLRVKDKQSLIPLNLDKLRSLRTVRSTTMYCTEPASPGDRLRHELNLYPP